MPARLVLGALLLVGAIVAAPSGIGLVWYVPYAGVGTILAIRRPGTSIGWILIALSWGMAIVMATVDATPEQFADGTLSTAAAALAVGQAVAGMVLFYLLAVLSIVFPSGRLPVGRSGAVARLGLGIGIAMLVAALFMPVISVSFEGAPTGTGVRNPIAVLPELPLWAVFTPDTVILPVVVLLAGSVGSLFVRFRRASGIERQQLRWITASLGLLIIGVLTGFVLGGIFPAASESGLAWLGPIVAIPLVPVAIGFAVLRYRLYEIDRIISRTISWALTTGLIVVLFAGLIVALQAVLAPITRQGGLAVAGSTLVSAAAFQPMRRRIQGAVDRRFNRRRYDAERIVAAYAAHLRGVTDLQAITDGAADSVARSLGPRGMAIWIRRSRGGTP